MSRGAFYGLTGENTGKFIWPGEIHTVDDHTPDAITLEAYYHENYDALPLHNPQYSSRIYTPVMYTDISTAAIGYAGAGLATVGLIATGAIVATACVNNPIGWAGCGGAAIAALGGGLGLTSAIATVGGAIITAMAPPDPSQYPVLSVSYASNLTGWGLPTAYTFP